MDSLRISGHDQLDAFSERVVMRDVVARVVSCRKRSPTLFVMAIIDDCRRDREMALSPDAWLYMIFRSEIRTDTGFMTSTTTANTPFADGNAAPYRLFRQLLSFFSGNSRALSLL